MHVSDTFRLHDSTGGPAISVSADNLSRQEVEGGKTTKFATKMEMVSEGHDPR